MHLRTTTAAVLSASLLALAACGGGGHDAATPATTSTTTAKSTTTSAAAGASSCAPADPKELLPLLPTTVPAGYKVQADDVGDTGPSDFAKAVSDDGEDDAAAVLRQAGFRRGYQRLWVNDADKELIAFLYEFCTPEGAQSYQARELTFPAGGETPFEVSGIADAKGYEYVGDDGTGAAVYAASGRYVIQAVADGPGDVTTTAEVEQLSKDLAVRLVENAASTTS